MKIIFKQETGIWCFEHDDGTITFAHGAIRPNEVEILVEPGLEMSLLKGTYEEYLEQGYWPKNEANILAYAKIRHEIYKLGDSMSRLLEIAEME